MLPRATHTRNRREAASGKQGGRTMEIQRLIARSLRAVVDLKVMGEIMITVDCDVIQADGGTRTASISGASVAMADAINSLLASGKLKKNPMKGHVAAVSVGIVGAQALCDLECRPGPVSGWFHRTGHSTIVTAPPHHMPPSQTGTGGQERRNPHPWHTP